MKTNMTTQREPAATTHQLKPLAEIDEPTHEKNGDAGFGGTGAALPPQPSQHGAITVPEPL